MSMMLCKSEVEAIKPIIEDALRERFGARFKSVKLTDVQDDEDCIRLIFDVTLDLDIDASRKFFGLTGALRRAMGDERTRMFPVIRPIAAA